MVNRKQEENLYKKNLLKIKKKAYIYFFLVYILIHAFFLCVYLFTHFFFAFMYAFFSLCAHKVLCCNIYTLCLYHVLLYYCRAIVISYIYTDLSQFEPNCWS